MPTPVRVRGKRGNRQLVKEWKTAEAAKAYTKSPATDANYRCILEGLPNELLQKVLWESLNTNLAWVSLDLAQRLNSTMIRQEFVFLAFFKLKFKTSPHTSDRGGRTTGNTDGDTDSDGYGWLIPRYHIIHCVDARVASLDEQSLLFVRKTILVQPWFTAKFFFSCQQQFIMKAVPHPLADLLNREFQQPVPQSCTIFWKNAPEQIPEWFMKVLSLQITNEQAADDEHDLDSNGNFKQSSSAKDWWLKINDRLSKIKGWNHDLNREVYYYDEKRLSIWKEAYDTPAGQSHVQRISWGIKELGKPTNWFVISTRFSHSPDLELPTRYYDPKVWTMDDFALLQILSNERAPNSVLMDVTRNGLMSAISQTFFPAVHYYSLIPESYHRWDDDYRDIPQYWTDLCEKIVRDAETREEHMDGSINTNFIIQSSKQQDFAEYIRTRPDEDMEVNPIGPEHIIKAMQIMCEPDATADNYDIFRYMSLAYAFKKRKNQEEFPNYELQEVHRLSTLAGTDIARKCYFYFNDLMDEIWYERTTRLFEYSSWFSPLSNRDIPFSDAE